MSATRLVMCADDAGFCRSSDKSILDCVRALSVTAVSVAVTGDTWKQVLRDLQDEPVDVGLHLSLTEGRAMAGPLEGMTDASGSFSRTKVDAMRVLCSGGVEQTALVDEVRAQWHALADHAQPTFVNGHNHIHALVPVSEALQSISSLAASWVRIPYPNSAALAVFQAAIGVAEIEGLRALGRSCQAFAGWSFAHNPTMETLEEEVRQVQPTTCEFMCHPGVRPGSAFTTGPARRRESAILCREDVRSRLHALGVGLVSFGELDS